MTDDREVPPTKRVYIDFVDTMKDAIWEFIGNYPRTDVIDLRDEEGRAHHFATSLASALDEPTGRRVYHPFGVDLSKLGDRERLRGRIRSARVVALEYTWNDGTVKLLRELYDELSAAARKRDATLPGVMYIADLESLAPRYEMFLNGVPKREERNPVTVAK